jgi:hypothetical protein
MLQFKCELHPVWKKYYIYNGSLVNNVILKISTKGNKSLNQLLIKKKTTKINVSHQYYNRFQMNLRRTQHKHTCDLS